MFVYLEPEQAAYGPVDATATPSSPASVKPRQFLLVPAHPGSPGQSAIKRLCVLVLLKVTR